MGNFCQNKPKRKRRRVRIYHQSQLQIEMTFTHEDMLDQLSCPIDNIKITDRKKSIHQCYPFQKLYECQMKYPPLKLKWKQIQISHLSHPFKCWFYSDQNTTTLDGFGTLFIRGKYSEYLIQGIFHQGNILPQKNYLKIFRQGDIYVGSLNERFQPEGEGQLIYENQDYYQGEFIHGLPHGQGILTSKRKFWKGQRFRGTLETPDQLYTGSFKDNLKQGQGTLLLKSGHKYIGKFSKNKKHGFGKLYDTDGVLMKKGTWNNDQQQ